jgi:hypothetical protein
MYIRVKPNINMYMNDKKYNLFIEDIYNFLTPDKTGIDNIYLTTIKELKPYINQTKKGILVRQGKGKGSFVTNIIKLNEFNIVAIIDSNDFNLYDFNIIKNIINNHLLIKYPYFYLSFI